MIKNRKIKRIVALLCLTVALSLTLSGCFTVQLGGVKSAEINEDGELILEYSGGREQNMGKVVGEDGKNGKDGKDGDDGLDGMDGKDGKDGKDGENAPGENGGNSSGNENTVIITPSQPDVEAAAAKSVFSAVSIKCGSQCGSGVIYEIDKASGDALIVTNYHVLYVASSSAISSSIFVYLYGSETDAQAIEAEYVGGSMEYDLAVIRVSNSSILKNSQAVAATFANSDEIQVGTTAIAIGNAKAMGISVTTGIVSVDSEYLTMIGADNKTKITLRTVRIDTAVNSGNSGGGLFDDEGNLIGIVNAKIIEDDVENMGYAIPSSTVASFLENIKATCLDTTNQKIKRAKVVEVDASNPTAVLDKNTGCVRIEETVVVVTPATGYLVRGTLQSGDVITEVSVNGGETVKITRAYQIDDICLSLKSGDQITFYYTRSGASYNASFNVTSSYLASVK